MQENDSEDENGKHHTLFPQKNRTQILVTKLKQMRQNKIADVHLEYQREVYYQEMAKEVICHKERVLDSPKQALTLQEKQGIQKDV